MMGLAVWQNWARAWLIVGIIIGSGRLLVTGEFKNNYKQQQCPEVVLRACENEQTTFELDLLTLRFYGYSYCQHIQLPYTYMQAGVYLCEPPCNWNDIFAASLNTWINTKHKKRDRFWISRRPISCLIDNKFGCNPMYITVKPMFSDAGTYVVGVDIKGTDELRIFTLEVNTNCQVASTVTYLPQPTIPSDKILAKKVEIDNPNDVVPMETGSGRQNTWLNWMLYTASTLNKRNCVLCAQATPALTTVPVNLNSTAIECLLYLMQPIPFGKMMDSSCAPYDYNYPVSNKEVPTEIMISPGNYTCYKITGKRTDKKLGRFPSEWCKNTTVLVGNYSVPRADVFWLGGDGKIRSTIPNGYHGQIALIWLILPIVELNTEAVIGWEPSSFRTPLIRRPRDVLFQKIEELYGVTNPVYGPETYIDAIGVPRGIPSKFKARCEIAAGWTAAIPVAGPIIETNKNVAWINYVYYNQQRLINLTYIGIKGLRDQLAPTSLMTWQNRMALDFLMAEKGGVCSMFKGHCCTFIPNNTAPGGSVSRALAGLKSLSEEVAKNSGIDDTFSNWFTKVFGIWGGYIKNLFLSILAAFLVFALLGCCCIPCLRALVERIMAKSVERAYLYTQLQQLPESEAELGGKEISQKNQDSEEE